MRQRSREPEIVDAEQEPDRRAEPAGRGTRALWGLVIFLAATLLVVAVTVASVAILVPDALSGSCIRPQLVRPEECAPYLNDN